MDLKKQALDLDKTENGVWIEIDEKTSVLIARYGSPTFNKRMSELGKPYKYALAHGTLSEKKSNSILNKVIAETILLGWSGLASSGVDLVYSRETAIEILSDPENEDFKQFILEASKEAANFRQKELTETLGKQNPPTSG